MTEARLWLDLIEHWIPMGMGNTGPTLPFLIGAPRVVGLRDGIANIPELTALLCSLQSAQSIYVRIDECTNLRQPVVGSYDRNMTMDASEIVRRTNGRSSLYVSQQYRHRQDIESVSDVLWKLIRSPVTNGQYSFDEGRYGMYRPKEIGFINKHGLKA